MKCFKEKEKFIEIVKKFGVNKRTIIFEINVLKLIDKYLPRLIDVVMNEPQIFKNIFERHKRNLE